MPSSLRNVPPPPTHELGDPLSDVAEESGIACLRVERWQLRAPWGIEFDPADAEFSSALMHCVVAGSAVVVAEGGSPRHVGPGGAVVMPRVTRHVVASGWPVEDEAMIRRPSATLAAGATANYAPGTGDATTTLLSMPFEIPSRLGRDGEVAVQASTETAIDSATEPRELGVLDGTSGDVLELMLLASKLVLLPGPGDRYVACRLAEAVLAKVLQRLAGAEQDQLGLFGFCASVGVKLALEAVASDVARGWSVGELAEIAGMSRTRFAQAFEESVGVGVPDFIAMRRLRALESLVAKTGTSIADAAQRVGFRSTGAVAAAVRRVSRFGGGGSLARVLTRPA